MKRLFITYICIILAVTANAQVARWLIEPSYDKINIASGIEAVRTDSAEFKTIWSFDGRRLLTTENDLFEFNEGIAVTARKGTTAIEALYKNDGSRICTEKNYNYTCKYPYFSCGRLLVHDGAYFRYINKDGTTEGGQFTDAFPFFNEYASCLTYFNMEKQKEIYPLLLTNEMIPVQFDYNGKTFDKADINFISSVNDENLAVVIIKHKIYTFDGTTGNLSPVFLSASETNSKNQARIDDDNFLQVSDNVSWRISAKCGKLGSVTFIFDDMMRPVSFTDADSLHTYKTKEKKEFHLDSPLRMAKDDAGLFGISWDDGEEILPPQFEEFLNCFDKKAFVKLDGKYGMLVIEEDGLFRMKLGDGGDIGFLHRNLSTTVRIETPIYISAEKTYLEFVGDQGIELDRMSKENKNTEFGNLVTYECELSIPENLSDELQEISYPVQLTYDGFRSPIFEYTTNAWFVKHYDIEIDENQRSIAEGAFSFIINIQKGDNRVIKFDVEVKPGTTEPIAEELQNDFEEMTVAEDELGGIPLPLLIEREEKITETRYKYKVSNLREGTNNIVIEVVEDGCPPAIFPYEIVYHKPVAKTKDTPEQVESIAITKKPKKLPKVVYQSTKKESKGLRPLKK